MIPKRVPPSFAIKEAIVTTLHRGEPPSPVLEVALHHRQLSSLGNIASFVPATVDN
ncbi:MAG: hypothetical protein JWQ44_968 [Chthoniobacter sp.]|nr:hypothetical protein [Chthoniobacter sp.]